MRFPYAPPDSMLPSRVVRVFKYMSLSAGITPWLSVIALAILASLTPSSRVWAQDTSVSRDTTSAPTEETSSSDEDVLPADDAKGSSIVEDSDQGVSLRTLEEQVNALKEKVFKSKARLVLLRETVLNGVISGAKAVITHRNDMGASFRLERMSYSLDGEPLFNKIDEDGNLDEQTEIELFEGSIVPGTHNLSVLLVYRGNGFGIFTYLRDYRFKIQASYPFTAEEGKVISVKAVAYERGGITTDLRERPNIRFETEVKKDVRAPPPRTVDTSIEASP